MYNTRMTFKPLMLVVFVFALSAAANAQATRTWVSGVGDDANPCSRTAPCKTFAGAISKTATNGEINCLDPAGYGSVTITKSITIDCEDTQGSILASLTTGVIVNITSGTDTKKAVKLRGITINGAGNGVNGIRILAATSVNVEEMVIDGFTTHGISVETTSGTPKISVDNTTIRSNNGNGINTFIVGGSVSLAVSRSRLNNNGTGLNLSSGTNATISNSVINGNTTGLLAANSNMGVLACDVSHNTTGISSLTGGNIRVMGTLITSNGTGLSASGGTLVSFISNVFTGNTVNGVPTSSLSLQ